MVTKPKFRAIKSVLLLAGAVTFAILLGEFVHGSGHYLCHLAYGNTQVRVHFDPFGDTRIIGANGLPDRVRSGFGGHIRSGAAASSCPGTNKFHASQEAQASNAGINSRVYQQFASTVYHFFGCPIDNGSSTMSEPIWRSSQACKRS
jgi:hypothetical protein